MHKKKIIHRDLKLENIFLTNNRSTIKIGDLGGSIKVKKISTDKEGWCGTITFFSPEFYFDCIQNYYAYDMWTIGCLTIEMLSLKDWISEDKVEHVMEEVFRVFGTPNENHCPHFLQSKAF